jgi:hypothetical protein
MRLRLDTNCLSRLPDRNSLNDFEFIVGEKVRHRYLCTSCAADLLSPAVFLLRQTDPLVSEFMIEIEDNKHLFDHIIALTCGNALVVQPQDCAFYQAVLAELGHPQLAIDRPNQIEDSTFLTLANSFDRLHEKVIMGLSIDAEIHFMASHFHEFKESAFKDLDVSCFALILSHRSFTAESENRVFDLILDRFNSDNSVFRLFEYVHFEYVLPDRMVQFVQIAEAMWEGLNPSIWKSISRRLLLAVDPVPQIRKFPFNTDPFAGIASHLGANVLVTCSSTAQGTVDHVHPLLHRTSAAYWASQDLPEQWFCFDFQSRVVEPTHYSIRSYVDGSVGNWNPKSWVVELSGDGQSWTPIDRRENNSDLNGAGLVKVFEVSKRHEGRYIRLRQIGANHAGSNNLFLSTFEVFGNLR